MQNLYDQGITIFAIIPFSSENGTIKILFGVIWHSKNPMGTAAYKAMTGLSVHAVLSVSFGLDHVVYFLGGLLYSASNQSFLSFRLLSLGSKLLFISMPMWSVPKLWNIVSNYMKHCWKLKERQKLKIHILFFQFY